jgi:glycosyltransferase involved in cell wall biosynthesis
MTRLTIVFCCNTAFGILNFRAGVIRALLARGHRVVVVAPPDPYAERLSALGVEYIEWALSGSSMRLAAELRAVRALIRIYREVRPDIAFHFTIKAVIYGAIAARCARVPFISVVTGLGYVFLNETWASKLSRALYRLTLGHSREVWFLNKDDRATFEAHGLVACSEGRLLPGEGVDMTHFAPVPVEPAAASSCTFLMIGRLLRDKGVCEYVEAARSVLAARPHVRFVLVGPADSANPTAIGIEQVRRWESEGLVRYLGAVDDVRPAIAASTCVVLPSYREGTPRCLLEAASMERPVVATDVPGCRDVVIDGKTGLLCAPRDAKDLAAKLLAITAMSDAELRSMGERARRFVREAFDERLVIDEYLDALVRLSEGRPMPAAA